ncbi:uncharacterized protein [Ptychodera flava]|uniref:uncharacterized protein n=1 Tax=Ptychodera flava TaxID=63121 RepID=UPI00396A6132
MKTRASGHEKEELSVSAVLRTTTSGQGGKPSAADDQQYYRLEESSVVVADQNVQDIQKKAAITPDEKQKTRDTKYDDEATGPVTAYKDQQSQLIKGLLGEVMAKVAEQGQQLNEKFAAQDEKFAALSKDMKELCRGLHDFKDTIAKKMDMFENGLINLDKVLKEMIEEKTAPLYEDLKP